MIKIGDIDIGKTILELQFQSKLNGFLIERILNGTETTQVDIEQLKTRAAQEVNSYYGGKIMITYTTKTPPPTPEPNPTENPQGQEE